MPNQPKTPMRTFRVPDDLWHAAKARSVAEGTSVTAILVAALRTYVKEQKP